MGHNQDSCAKLLTQLRKYMKNKAPFNQNYNYKSDTPTIWWETAQNSKEEWELQALALRLFAVSPHSASCERSFSVLGWFYSQRRTKLAADRVEGMCKLHTYYITNAKRELPYYAVDTSECSLREKMIDSTLTEISDELVGEGDYDFLYEENIIDTIIDMSKTYNLNVALDIDIDSHIFNMERNESEEDEVIVSHRRQTVVLDPEREDYDIEALIAKEMNDDNGS
uniref:HAT C-terminal dimerisation domain-containing protein n=1 Tax=Rhizophagus irregularis (strain DAOM 181602 / DAOM 197198 / MUCL 43194) TaxID=747089 RepID=U9U7C7_RHIID